MMYLFKTFYVFKDMGYAQDFSICYYIVIVNLLI